MLRFLTGAVTAAVALVAAYVGFTAWQLSVQPKLSAELAEMPEPPVVQLAAPGAAEPAPAPQPAAEVAARAQAERRVDLLAEVMSGQPIPEVSDVVAVSSAGFAETMRRRTGAVPDADAQAGTALIDFSTGSSTGAFRDRMRTALPAYFETWDDLLARCFAVVSTPESLDEADLTASGDDRIDYAKAFTSQKWFSVDKAFSIQIETEAGQAETGLLRTCVLKTNRFALVRSEDTGPLKARFHDWWARQGYEAETDTRDYPWELSEHHQWWGGQTRFGSAQGCPILIEASAMTIANETQVTLFMKETDRDGCTLPQATGTGGVRINRLPQAGN